MTDKTDPAAPPAAQPATSSEVTASDVVAFWSEAGPDAWYSKDAAFDETIRRRFGSTWKAARDGELEDWAMDAEGALGLIILLDQFPRNMFRDDPRAFATDEKALAVTETMLKNAWDREIHGAMRQFVYMPLMHSEKIAHQDLCVDLMDTRMGGGNNALHARVHREIIDRFGRFPYRNAALGREATPDEQEFLDDGGYARILKEIEGNPESA